MKRNVILRYVMAVLMMAVAGEVCAQVKVEGSERGKKAVVIGGKKAMGAAREKLLDAVSGSALSITDFKLYGKEASYEAAAVLEKDPAVREADMIFAVGGGKACNRLIAHRLVLIMRQLYDAGYGIERMVLPDVYDADDERQMTANNSSCFCYRRVAGSKKLSNHARGLAVDINPLYNPHCRPGRFGRLVVHPSAGRKYSDRSLQFPYKIVQGDVCYRAFTRQGFSWGGAWRNSKDYQHFEWGDD